MLPRNWIKKAVESELVQYNINIAAMERAPEGGPKEQMLTLAYRGGTALKCDISIVKIHDRTHSCSDVTGQMRRYANREACPTLMALVRKRVGSVGYDPAWGK